jgi:hypothetical protein
MSLSTAEDLLQQPKANVTLLAKKFHALRDPEGFTTVFT